MPNNHILTQNLYYNYYYPKPKYLIIGYLDPLGLSSFNVSVSRSESDGMGFKVRFLGFGLT